MSSTPDIPTFRPAGLAAVLLLLAAELGVIGVAYKHLIDFECLANWPAAICGGASGLMISVYTMTGALGLLTLLAPEPVRRLLSGAAARGRPLALNLAGAVVMLAPIPLLREGAGTVHLPVVLGAWALGIGLGGAGAALMLSPLSGWRQFLRDRGPSFVAVAAAGLIAPVLAVQIQPIWWSVEGLASGTFAIVSRAITILGFEVYSDPARRIIGAGDFYIDIAPVCSGIEGMALVAVFVTIYLALFARDLRFPAALVLYPLGILVSAALNVVRIVALLALGLSGQPDLAVGGFHSHAGWLMFTVLAVAIALAAHRVPALKRRRPHANAPVAAAPAFTADPAAARIFPFIVFMASALLASTFAATPTLVYPLRALASAAALWLFRAYLRALPWRIDGLAVGSGAVIAVAWVVTSPATEATALDLALSGLGPLAFAVWAGARILGTAILVPIIEELFFRGYLMTAIAGAARPPWRIGLAILVSTASFAALHDRWIAAALAGLVFAALSLRSGRVTDAILCHAVANALIAAAALAAGDWSLI